MNTNKIKRAKSQLKLTNRQRAIITGLLLGDGHLETQDGGRTYRLKVEHGSEQSDYVQWLFWELRNWIPAEKPYIKIRKNGVRNVGFTTYSHGALRFYGHQFYQDKKKRMPKIITRMIEPISIAVWFMDDGSLKSERHRTYIIHALGFSKTDLTLVQQALQKKFSIETRVHRQKEVYWRLYVMSKSAHRFETLIRDYSTPIPSMRKKLVTHA